MLLIAIVPTLWIEWTVEWLVEFVEVAVVLLLLLVVAWSLLFAIGVVLSVNGNLTQLPPPVIPVLSSKSSPVWRWSQAFLRCRGALGLGADGMYKERKKHWNDDSVKFLEQFSLFSDFLIFNEKH